MYVYIKSEIELWTVGFYAPNGNWNSESDHNNKDDAAERVAWLNGNNSALSKPSQEQGWEFFKYDDLKRGDIVQHKDDEISYVISEVYRDNAVAIKTISIVNVIQWKRLISK